MNKQITATLLFCALLLAGCGDSTPADTTAAAVQEQEMTASAGPRDGLPEDLDFGGTEVKIHAGLWMGITSDPLSEYYVEEATGDVVDDAVFNRNRTVEDRLNVKLTYTWHETEWASR